jgi:hypothetical protein
VIDFMAGMTNKTPRSRDDINTDASQAASIKTVSTFNYDAFLMYWSRWLTISTALNSKKKRQKLTFLCDR